MKATRSFVVFIVTFIALFAFDARGENPLPTSLPIGSLPVMWEWGVTNRLCDLSFKLLYTDQGGVYRSVRISATRVPFSSYAGYQECLFTNCLKLYNLLLTRTNVASRVTLLASVWYLDIQRFAFVIDTDLGPLDLIDQSVFKTVQPTQTATVVPVQDLARFKVEVFSASSLIYSYEWPSGQTTGEAFAMELTTNNLVSLSSWYSTGLYRARFTLAAGGYTNMYTQAGSLLLTNPPISISAKNGTIGVTVNMSRGSDTTLWASEDLQAWKQVAIFSWTWDVSTTTVSWPLDKSAPNRFFRATSE